MDPFRLGLKQILEDRSIFKVFHDFCEDASALVRQYQVHCDGVFDTQIAHRLLTEGSEDSRDMNLNLNNFLSAYLGTGCENKKKEVIVAQMRVNPHFWH